MTCPPASGSWFAAGVDLIAGRLLLPDVMAHLSARRPVFHSEADFRFAFAQSVAALDDSVSIRLAVPQRAAHRACVDLRCTADEVSLLQLTYVTRRWAGSDGRTDELFDLRGHEALELARLHFIHDVTRLERWTDEQPSTNGFALLLTNDARLWEAPPTTNPGDAASGCTRVAPSPGSSRGAMTSTRTRPTGAPCAAPTAPPGATSADPTPVSAARSAGSAGPSPPERQGRSEPSARADCRAGRSAYEDGRVRRSRVHVTGASGAGTSTLARALADHWSVPHADVDDYFWVPTDPPYRDKRPEADRVTLMRRVFAPREAWVLSGSMLGWGESIVAECDAVVFLTLDAEERLRRLEARETVRQQGRDADPAAWAAFLDWARGYDDPSFDGRSRVAHEAWLAVLSQPVLRLDSARPREELRDAVLDWEPADPA